MTRALISRPPSLQAAAAVAEKEPLRQAFDGSTNDATRTRSLAITGIGSSVVSLTLKSRERHRFDKTDNPTE